MQSIFLRLQPLRYFRLPKQARALSDLWYQKDNVRKVNGGEVVGGRLEDLEVKVLVYIFTRREGRLQRSGASFVIRLRPPYTLTALDPC